MQNRPLFENHEYDQHGSFGTGGTTRGQVAYQRGLSAEATAARHFEQRGGKTLATRWRGSGGELDLVIKRDGVIHFVEVKASDSWTAAAARLGARQVERIQGTALEFLADAGETMDTEMQFDVALVNADGEPKILPNAFM